MVRRLTVADRAVLRAEDPTGLVAEALAVENGPYSNLRERAIRRRAGEAGRRAARQAWLARDAEARARLARETRALGEDLKRAGAQLARHRGGRG